MTERLARSSADLTKRLIASAALLATLLTSSAIASTLTETSGLDRGWEATAARLTAQAEAYEEEIRWALRPTRIAQPATRNLAKDGDRSPAGGIGSSMPLMAS